MNSVRQTPLRSSLCPPHRHGVRAPLCSAEASTREAPCACFTRGGTWAQAWGLSAPDLLQDSVGPAGTGQGAAGRHPARAPSQGPVWPLSAPGGLSALRTRWGVGRDACPALGCLGDGHRGSGEAGEHAVLLRAGSVWPAAPGHPHGRPRASSNQTGAPRLGGSGWVERRPFSPGIRLRVGELAALHGGHPAQPSDGSPETSRGGCWVEGVGRMGRTGLEHLPEAVRAHRRTPEPAWTLCGGRELPRGWRN